VSAIPNQDGGVEVQICGDFDHVELALQLQLKIGLGKVREEETFVS
jgi:hypothetical protein